MAAKNKKSRSKKTQKATPMPSLIFSEGKIDNPANETSATPKADLIEQQLIEENKEPTFDHLAGYNPAAKKLMWSAVISLTLVVCLMWSWSIYSQFTSIDWSKVSERNLINDTKKNWTSSFQDENGNRLSADQQVKSIKSNLEKLFAGAAASSSPTTSTPEVLPTSTTTRP